jgi:hypothetical protein
MSSTFSGSKNNPSKNSANFGCYIFYASFSLGLFFDPERGGDAFVQNVGLFSTNNIALSPKYRTIFIGNRVCYCIENPAITFL